ncbi:MAG TPA: HAD family phosphatase [Terriglobales bacterium]|jgi:sugar-phosphatase
MNLQSDIQAVVFDMDGVLIDSHPAHRAAWKAFLQSVDREVSDDQLAFILEGRTRDEILRHFLGDLSTVDIQEFGRQKDEIFRLMEHEIKSVPGVLEFLDSLRDCGVSCAVATSASEIRTFSTIERMGLADHFESIVTASDVHAGKPHPMVYQLACEQLSVSPSKALAFDDAPAGIHSAKAAGMRCIGISSNGLTRQLLDSGAERVISDFLGLSLEALR